MCPLPAYALINQLILNALHIIILTSGHGRFVCHSYNHKSFSCNTQDHCAEPITHTNSLAFDHEVTNWMYKLMNNLPDFILCLTTYC